MPTQAQRCVLCPLAAAPPVLAPAFQDGVGSGGLWADLLSQPKQQQPFLPLQRCRLDLMRQHLRGTARAHKTEGSCLENVLAGVCEAVPVVAIVGNGGCCSWYELGRTITADIRHRDKTSPSRTCKVVSFFSQGSCSHRICSHRQICSGGV